MKHQARTIRNLCIFIFVALSCGWIGVWVDSLTGETTGDFSDTSNGTSGNGYFYSGSPAYLALVARLYGRWLERCRVASAYQEKPALVWSGNPYLPCGDCRYPAYRRVVRLAGCTNPVDGLFCGLWYFCSSRICKEFL